MTPKVRTSAIALATLLLLGACSSSPSGSGTPPAQGSAAASTPAASTAAASAPAASEATTGGEPCSFLTAEQVGGIVGTTPVEVAERIGRGDCDYWLTTAKDSKVNVGVFAGAEATSYFEQTKGIGTPEVVNVGDEAYSIFNESIGTVVVARKGDAVVAVQVFAGAGADQLRQATALVEAILAASLTP